MITITKSQMEYLLSKGLTFGDDIHSQHSGHKKWYATESSKVKKYLAEYSSKHVK